MKLPSLEDFAAFVQECDHIWPLGWPLQPGQFTVSSGNSTKETIERQVVGRWLYANENYREAERHLERSKFFRSLEDEGARAFARARLAIDAGCAIGEYLLAERQEKTGTESQPPPSYASREDRRQAQELARDLLKLMEKRIDLASEYRTRTLYWALRDLEQELDGQLRDEIPITTPQRRDETAAERALVYALARRFFKSFLEPLPSAIESIVGIVAPEKLDEKTVRNICRDLKGRRDKAPGTWFLKPSPSGKTSSGS